MDLTKFRSEQLKVNASPLLSHPENFITGIFSGEANSSHLLSGDLANLIIEGAQSFVHLQVDAMIQLVIDRMRLWIGFESVTDASHFRYSGLEVGMHPHSDGGIDRRAQAGGFVNMRAGSRQAEDVGSELQRGITLAAAACNPQLRDRDVTAASGPLGAFAQGMARPSRIAR